MKIKSRLTICTFDSTMMSWICELPQGDLRTSTSNIWRRQQQHLRNLSSQVLSDCQPQVCRYGHPSLSTALRCQINGCCDAEAAVSLHGFQFYPNKRDSEWVGPWKRAIGRQNLGGDSFKQTWCQDHANCSWPNFFISPTCLHSHPLNPKRFVALCWMHTFPYIYIFCLSASPLFSSVHHMYSFLAPPPLLGIRYPPDKEGMSRLNRIHCSDHSASVFMSECLCVIWLEQLQMLLNTWVRL